jgi:VanZ family protein
MKFSVPAAQPTPNRLGVVLPLLIMAMLYWLSSLPGVPAADDPEVYAVFYWMPPTVQNILHVPAYAALASAWRWALEAWLRHSSARVIGAGAIASVYGVLDEWHQSFVPGRFASLTDVTLDIAGAVLGVWLAAIWFRASRSSDRNSSR